MLKKRVPPTKIEKFTSSVLKQGKKTIANTIMSEAFAEMRAKGSKNPEETFMLAIENVTPLLEVKARRIGGSNYQIPTEVTPRRKETLPIRWILDAARSRKGVKMSTALAIELMDASKNEGNAVKKKDDTHRMAEANTAFAHFARYAN